LERFQRELGRAYRIQSLTYKESFRSGKVFYRQSEELIVARRIGTT
jgi:hypothetical protein